jgi:hypothetical protein
LDTARLKKSLARVAMHGDEVALFSYSGSRQTGLQ